MVVINPESSVGWGFPHRLVALAYPRSVALIWEQTTIDAADPQRLGLWWAAALDWVIVDESPDVCEIRPDARTLPGLLFLRNPHSKVTKNRLHIDLRPDDQSVEVDRLLGLGAHRVNINQGQVGWVVLADPEGNEFCVLSGTTPN